MPRARTAASWTSDPGSPSASTRTPVDLATPRSPRANAALIRTTVLGSFSASSRSGRIRRTKRSAPNGRAPGSGPVFLPRNGPLFPVSSLFLSSWRRAMPRYQSLFSSHHTCQEAPRARPEAPGRRNRTNRPRLTPTGRGATTFLPGPAGICCATAPEERRMKRK